jgi:phospholipid/cholesterol/gamma-HCH transport system substrate-binding protein
MAIRAADPRLTLRVGAGMMVVLVIAIVYLLFLRDRLFLGPSVNVRVYFHHVGPLKEGAEVIVAGRTVGKITSIRLVPREGLRDGHVLAGAGGVEAIARIYDGRRHMVPVNGDFFVSSRGIFSERYLEVGPPLDGAEPGAPAFDGMEVLATDPPTMDRVWQDAWDNLQIAKVFMAEVGPEARSLFAVIDELGATITDIEPGPGEYDRLRASVDRAVTEARTMYLALEVGGATPADIRGLMARARIALDQMGATTRTLRVRLAEIDGDFSRMRGRIDKASPGLELKVRLALRAADGALERLERLQAKVSDLMGIIERGEGTIGRIANDPEFPEDAKELGKILKRTPARVVGHPQDEYEP